MIAYILIFTATLLFSLQFVFQRGYNKSEGFTLRASLMFSFLTSVVRILLVFVIYGFSYTFTGFGVLVAFISAFNALLNVYCSAKAFEYADLSLYSMFAMLGGMVLPFIAGVAAYDEPLKFTGILCCVLVTVALLMGTTKGDTKNNRAILYYLGVFFSNGMSGVFAKINQGSENGVSSEAFLLLGGVWLAVICAVLLAVDWFRSKERLIEKPKTALLFAAGFGVMSALGNLFVLIALETLPASVQYPIITGGTIIISTAIAWISKEKLSWRKIVSVVISFAAVCLLCIE